MLAPVQITQVVVVAVCLSFQGDVPVGIAFHKKAYHPFGDIPQIKEYETHLDDLCRVDALMVD